MADTNRGQKPFELEPSVFCATLSTMGAVVVATDGSDVAERAAAAGIAILHPPDRVVLVTVIEGADPSLTQDGGGHAGPSMSPSEFQTMRKEFLAAGDEIVGRLATSLDRSVESRVIEGRAGAALCEFAKEMHADAIVMGTRGRGGLRRAFLGSVSDYVLRNAPCPVLIAATALTDCGSDTPYLTCAPDLRSRPIPADPSPCAEDRNPHKSDGNQTGISLGK